MRKLKKFLILLIALILILLCYACIVPQAKGNSDSNTNPNPGNAIGWIGGGVNSWQTGAAPVSYGADYQSFHNPDGVSVDGFGNIYVADSNNNRICKWNSSGTAIGWIGGGTDGVGWKTGAAPASGTGFKSFNGPQGVFVDGFGFIYVADFTNNRICRWDAYGNANGWIGGGPDGWQTGAAPASGTDYHSFNGPTGVCVDASGNIYVADSNNNRICKWYSNGNVDGWIGGGNNGWSTGTAPASGTGYKSFNNPTGVSVDGFGNIYVADFSNNRICKWDKNGTPIGCIGGGSNSWKTGATSAGFDYQSFHGPAGVYIDGSGNIYVSDESNSRICKWDSNGNAIGWIGGRTNGWRTDSATSGGFDYKSFSSPFGVNVDGSGNIYVGDFFINRICKWK